MVKVVAWYDNEWGYCRIGGPDHLHGGATVKTIRHDRRLAGRRVLVREDLNVPWRDGASHRHTRIKASLPTIKDLSHRGAFVIVLPTSAGRRESTSRLSLRPVARSCWRELWSEVKFSSLRGASGRGGRWPRRLTRRRADAREHPLPSRRDEQNDPGLARASSPRSATYSSTTRSAPRTARMLRP